MTPGWFGLNLADAREAVLISLAAHASALARDLGLQQVADWTRSFFAASHLAIHGEWAETRVADGDLSQEMRAGLANPRRPVPERPVFCGSEFRSKELGGFPGR